MYKLFFLRENSPKTAIKEIPISNESTQVLWVKITEKKKKKSGVTIHHIHPNTVHKNIGIALGLYMRLVWLANKHA